jgi:hypothetical protein
MGPRIFQVLVFSQLASAADESFDAHSRLQETRTGLNHVSPTRFCATMTFKAGAQPMFRRTQPVLSL